MLGPLVDSPRLKITRSVRCDALTTFTGMPPMLPIQGSPPQVARSVAPRSAPSTDNQVPDFVSTGRFRTSAWNTVSAGIRVQPQKVDSGALWPICTVTGTATVPLRPSSMVTSKLSCRSAAVAVGAVAFCSA